MAAVFQLPMPVHNDGQPPQIIPRRRPRESVEIIDVDSLEDDLYQGHRSTPVSTQARPPQFRRNSAPMEVISLLDSDDEQPTNSNASTRSGSRTRLQSPPPPQPLQRQWAHVPPVPPVPRQYAGQISLPMGRRPPPFPSPPVIRPNDHPFPFEADMRLTQQQEATIPGSPNLGARASQSALPPETLQAAPPSHHIPALGLGGALIAENRARQRAQQDAHTLTGSSLLGRVGTAVGSGVRRILGGPGGLNFLNFGFLDDALDDNEDVTRFINLRFFGDGEPVRDIPLPSFNPYRAYARNELLHRRSNRDEVSYKPEYTHPHPLDSGFTSDFAQKAPPDVIDVTSPVAERKKSPIPVSREPIVITDDEDEVSIANVAGPSTPSASSSIVVEPSTSIPTTPKTRPAIIPGTSTGVNASTNLDARGTTTSTVANTLLVCARCLDPLVLGNNITSEDQVNRRIWGLRCGHLIDGKCLREIGQPAGFTVPTVTVDRKGKGKAKMQDIESESYGSEDSRTPGSLVEHNDRPEESNSIRSRLRSHHQHLAAMSSTSSAPASPYPRRSSARKPPRQKVVPPPEFIWNCPVAGCGRVHVSVCKNGEWAPDKGKENNNMGMKAGKGRGGGRGRFHAAGFPEVNGGGSGNNGEGPRGAIPLFL